MRAILIMTALFWNTFSIETLASDEATSLQMTPYDKNRAHLGITMHYDRHVDDITPDHSPTRESHLAPPESDHLAFQQILPPLVRPISYLVYPHTYVRPRQEGNTQSHPQENEAHDNSYGAWLQWFCCCGEDCDE